MQKIQIVADSKQLEASGVDVTVVSLGDMLRPASLAPGQSAVAVGARGGSMWQLISRPLASRAEAETAIRTGFEPLDTEVAVSWCRSLMAMGVAALADAHPEKPVLVSVSGKPRQIKEILEAHRKAEEHFGRLSVGNPPAEGEEPGFQTIEVEQAKAFAYRTWVEDRFGIKRGAISCDVAPRKR